VSFQYGAAAAWLLGGKALNTAGWAKESFAHPVVNKGGQ